MKVTIDPQENLLIRTVRSKIDPSRLRDFKHRAVTCVSFTEGTDPSIVDTGLLFTIYGPRPTLP